MSNTMQNSNNFHSVVTEFARARYRQLNRKNNKTFTYIYKKKKLEKSEQPITKSPRSFLIKVRTTRRHNRCIQ